MRTLTASAGSNAEAIAMPQTARVIARIRTFIDCSYGRCTQTDRRSRRSIHIDASTRRMRGRERNHRHGRNEKHGKQDQNGHLSLHCLLASMLGEETHGDDHEMARRDEIMSRCICSRTIPCLQGAPLSSMRSPAAAAFGAAGRTAGATAETAKSRSRIRNATAISDPASTGSAKIGTVTIRQDRAPACDHRMEIFSAPSAALPTDARRHRP